jgi:uncharacterized protein (TIGR02117 family)
LNKHIPLNFSFSHYMKSFLIKIVRILLRSLLVFIGLVLLYLLCVWLLPKIPVNRGFTEPASGVTIYIESNGVHTDVVVPVKHELIDWTSYIPFSDFENAGPSCSWMAFGWGDKGFYLETPTWADLKFSTAFEAVLFLGSTAMHVTCKQAPEDDPEYVRELVITEEQYQKLIAYIIDSFEKDASGKFIRIDHPGYSDRDCFYEAHGTYSFLNTCNEWTGNALEHAGVRVGFWTPLDRSVFEQLGEKQEK